MGYSLEFAVHEVGLQTRILECANITPSKVFVDTETYVNIRNAGGKCLQHRYTAEERKEWFMDLRLYEVPSEDSFVSVA